MAGFSAFCSVACFRIIFSIPKHGVRSSCSAVGIQNIRRPNDRHWVWNINSETGAVSITFQDFLPKVQANDFITNMLKIPCASMYPRGRQFVIETNADILSGASDVRVWDDKLIGIPSISIEEGKEYECGYNGDEGTVPDDIIPVKVQTIEDMFRDALAGDELKTYQIESTGQIIESQFDTEMGNRYKFRVVRQSMGGEDKTGDDDPEKDEKSSYDAKVNGTVLWTNLRAIINTDTIATRVFQYVPEGEAIEEDRPDTLTVGLFWGYRNQLYENESSVSDTYPYMSHCNYDGGGNRLGRCYTPFRRHGWTARSLSFAVQGMGRKR